MWGLSDGMVRKFRFVLPSVSEQGYAVIPVNNAAVWVAAFPIFDGFACANRIECDTLGG
jgi:hypothetical protein